MTISVQQLGKRYIRHWVFRNINTTFESPKQYAVLGPNGSGKSTFLRIIGGMQAHSSGKVLYEHQGKEISSEKIFDFVSFCAPGMDVVEEMTLGEFLKFHFSFKPILKGWTIGKIIQDLGLQHVEHQQIVEFSSGMKQRVKLAQAFFSNTPILLLDEPLSNLDLAGTHLYNRWLKELTTDRLVIIASNDPREYEGAESVLEIEHFKQQ